MALLACFTASPLIAEDKKAAPASEGKSNRPNIIFFFTDDHGWRDSEPYGNPYIKTPNMTRLAKESMQFMHAYAASPTCSPSRSTVVTGLMPHRCGADFFGAPIARDIKVMSGYFNEAGYHTVSVGKSGYLHGGWGLSSPRSNRYTQGIGDVDRADEYIRKYKGEKPLFMYIGCGEPHQPWQKNKIYDPEKIPVPPNYVDTPETRLALADYYQDVTIMDEKLGKVLDALDAREDLKKNTIFIFSTDQGAHLPFGKWNLYDTGLRVPFMASWPGVIEPGSKTESMINLADVLPTFLEAAGESIPDGLDGKSFLPVLKDGSQKHRDVVFGTHTGNNNGPENNHNNNPMRTIRTPTHRYIFNLEPDRLFNTSCRTHDPRVSPRAYYKTWQEKAKTDDFAKRMIQAFEHRPADELYDLEADPYEMNNLADDPKHAELLKSLKAQVTEWCKTQDDVEALKKLDPNFAPAASQQPNIVFILSDDQAWTDYGFMGHKDIKTPHLDKLAKRSLVFERGYVASPLCRPSLASLATGLYPFQHGITGNDVGNPAKKRAALDKGRTPLDTELGVNGGKDRATLDAPIKAAFHKHPSFIKMLTSNGYLAHQSGKWWEGSYKDGGFTHGMTHGDPKRGGRHGDVGLKIGRRSMKPVTDFIDLATKEKKPFLLWYAPFLPHTPHNPPKRLLEKYTKPGQAEDVAKYYAMCEWFDETCGQLLGYLDKKNLTENTMVIYICDNGWAAASTNASDPNQKLWKGFALRSKASPYENGIRTPIMISWPGHVRTGNTQRAPAHAIDIFPTIAAAAGLKAPENLQGINLLNAEARRKRRPVFGVTNSIQDMTPGDPDSTLQYLWCIKDSWKLLVRYDGKDTTRYKNLHIWDTAPVRLYKLKNDPHEKKDLAGANPHIVKRLRRKIEAWHLK
jgi:arylsulfatase A-like enzyme